MGPKLMLGMSEKKAKSLKILLNYVLTPHGREGAPAVTQDLHQGRGLTWGDGGGNTAALNLCLKNSQQQRHKHHVSTCICCEEIEEAIIYIYIPFSAGALE